LLVIMVLVFLTPPIEDATATPTIARVERPFACQSNNSVFVDCFLCGRVANDKRVYFGCCAGIKLLNRYCEMMLM